MDEKIKEILTAIHEGNADGLQVSFESSDLIAEVEEDIKTFGADFEVYVWAKYYPEYNTAFVVDYDFITTEPPTEDDIGDDEEIGITTLGNLLAQLKKQNEIVSE